MRSAHTETEPRGRYRPRGNGIPHCARRRPLYMGTFLCWGVCMRKGILLYRGVLLTHDVLSHRTGQPMKRGKV